MSTEKLKTTKVKSDDQIVNAVGASNFPDNASLAAHPLAESDNLTEKAPPAAAATTTTNISKVYQHWANGDRAVTTDDEWNNNILSPNKSDYFEGEVIPHVFVYKASNSVPLETGKTYSFNITYNYYQANSNAGGFSYITTYNSTVTPASLTNSAPVADNDVFTLHNSGGVDSQCQFYVSSGSDGKALADISQVSAVTYTGSGTKDGHLTVSFVYTGPTTSSGAVEIYYGLKVAEPGSVPDQGMGETNGAHAWTGGSLQTTVDINGSGATSIQLMPSAIIVGEISGMKFNDINGDGVRDADGADNQAGTGDDEAGLSGWTLFIDSNNNGQFDAASEKYDVTDSEGHYAFSVTPDANKATPENDGYLIREVAQPGWVQTTANPAAIVISAADPTETGVNFGNMQMLPAIQVIKSGAWEDADGDGQADVGELVRYTFDVTNTGNVALQNVTVTDPLVTVAGGPTTLDVGETDAATFTGRYAITQADIDAGFVYNLATAKGYDAQGNLASDDDDNTAHLAQNPAIEVVKTGAWVDGDGDGQADVGEMVHYTFAVTNTGNVTLHDVTVSDPLVTVNGGPTTLEVGETDPSTFTGHYAITQADIDAGWVANTATAQGFDPQGDRASDDDDHTAPLAQNPAIEVVKTGTWEDADSDGHADVGELVHYTFAVTNTGNVTLHDVTVSDPLVTITGGPSTLDVGETDAATFTGRYALTQADIDAGFVYNIATAKGYDAQGDAASDDDDHTAPLGQTPAIEVVKTGAWEDGDGDGQADVGEVVHYSFAVSNAGNVTLHAGPSHTQMS